MMPQKMKPRIRPQEMPSRAARIVSRRLKTYFRGTVVAMLVEAPRRPAVPPKPLPWLPAPPTAPRHPGSRRLGLGRQRLGLLGGISGGGRPLAFGGHLAGQRHDPGLGPADAGDDHGRGTRPRKATA